MEHRLMTDDEKAAVFRQVYALEEAGKKDEARELRMTVPIPAFLAKVIKDKMGIDVLKQCDFNLAEAEMKYGRNWLT